MSPRPLSPGKLEDVQVRNERDVKQYCTYRASQCQSRNRRTVLAFYRRNVVHVMDRMD